MPSDGLCVSSQKQNTSVALSPPFPPHKQHHSPTKTVTSPNPAFFFPPLTEPGNSSLLKLDTSDVETTRAFNTIESYARRTKLKRQKITDAIADVGRSAQATDLERMSSQSRRWQMGDVYAPHDLSPREFKKWRQRSKPDRDVFDALNINPRDEYKVNNLRGESL
jgi:hypothetical protein